MKRLARIAIVALPLMTLATAPAYAEVKTRDKTQVKFEGMLGRMFNLFGGKSAKEGVEGRTAVKGNRKATMNDSGGTIVDLSEEKIYDIDVKKKQYTVTTFEELRRRMREAQEKAKQQVDREEPRQKQEDPQKPTKEYEVDFDVKDTGQKKQIAGYDAKNTVVTITVREKGRTLDEAGGVVMTNDMWLGPAIPQLKELYEFDIKYAKQLQGPEAAAISAEQMAAMLAMFPLIGKATDRMQKDAGKLAGTPLETTTTFEAVRSKDQLIEAQESSAKSSSGGGIGGLLAKKMIKKDEPKARTIIATTHHEVLEVSMSVAPADLAIPADFKEKK
jgi:hypothetical protein